MGALAWVFRPNVKNVYAHMFIKKEFMPRNSSVREESHFVNSLTGKEVILLRNIVNSFNNHGGVVFTNTLHQSFFFVADVNLLFHLVHCLQGYTTQTLTESLWGADLLVFPVGQVYSDHSFGPLPPPKNPP